MKTATKHTFKAGDKAKVLDGSKIYTGITWMMEELVGKTVTIDYVDSDGDCYLKAELGVAPYVMKSAWLEPIEKEQDGMNRATEYKFKIGDRVRVLDGSEIEDYVGDWAMDEYIGMTLTVENRFECDGKNAYALNDRYGYTWDERGLELANEIKRGDIHKALLKVIEEDEMVKKLTAEMPLMILVLGIIVEKLEDELFGKETKDEH